MGTELLDLKSPASEFITIASQVPKRDTIVGCGLNFSIPTDFSGSSRPSSARTCTVHSLYLHSVARQTASPLYCS